MSVVDAVFVLVAVSLATPAVTDTETAPWPDGVMSAE